VALLSDRLRNESTIAMGGTWLAFVVAAALAVPQPPSLASLAMAAAVGVLFVVIGFLAGAESRSLPAHPARRRVELASLAAAAGAVLGLVLQDTNPRSGRASPAG
jgi:zinc transporter ZupT